MLYNQLRSQHDDDDVGDGDYGDYDDDDDGLPAHSHQVGIWHDD